MILTRAALRIVKPLWSSISARYSSLRKIECAPCCTAIPGDYTKKRGILTSTDDEYDENALDSFIGEWHEVESKNYRKFLEASGVKGDELDLLENSKSWMYYEREDELWILQYGYTNSTAKRYLCFTIGEYFDHRHTTGQPMKGIIFPDKGKMHEIYETITPPQIVITIDREVFLGPRWMISTLKLNDVVATKKYERYSSFDEDPQNISVY